MNATIDRSTAFQQKDFEIFVLVDNDTNAFYDLFFHEWLKTITRIFIISILVMRLNNVRYLRGPTARRLPFKRAFTTRNLMS